MLRRYLIGAVLFFGVPLTTSVQAVAMQAPAGGAATVDVETVGPRVGATIPAFSLPDQYGETRPLASLMGPKGLVLVFFRSADW